MLHHHSTLRACLVYHPPAIVRINHLTQKHYETYLKGSIQFEKFLNSQKKKEDNLCHPLWGQLKKNWITWAPRSINHLFAASKEEHAILSHFISDFTSCTNSPSTQIDHPSFSEVTDRFALQMPWTNINIKRPLARLWPALKFQCPSWLYLRHASRTWQRRPSIGYTNNKPKMLWAGMCPTKKLPRPFTPFRQLLPYLQRLEAKKNSLYKVITINQTPDRMLFTNAHNTIESNVWNLLGTMRDVWIWRKI